MGMRCAIALLAFFFRAHACAAPPVTLLTEEYAPYAWTGADGKVQGISTEIVAEIFKRAGIAAATPKVLPWARAISIAEQSANTCLYTTARTPEREHLFKWIGPIGQLEWVLFARSADRIVLRTLDDARPYTVGTYVTNATVPLLRKHRIKVELTSSDRANPQKLKLGRIDLWAVGQAPGLQLMRDMNIQGIEAVFTLATTGTFLACHKGMSDTQVDSLNAALESMYSAGVIEELYTRHGYAALTPKHPTTGKSR